MYTVDFAQINELQHQGLWAEANQILCDAASSLERGGADLILICSNTMHKMFAEIEQAVNIPLLHIADSTAQQIKATGLSRVGLLGTAFTMEHEFYKGRLQEKYGLDVIVPNEADRKIIHNVIYDELLQGYINPASKAEYLRIMQDLIGQGAQGLILGCTEIMLLVSQLDSTVPVFDTTTLHAVAAVNWAISEA